MDNIYYIIYRIYKNRDEHYFGWTTDKNVLKGFIKQRSSKKYGFVRITEDEIEDKVPNTNGELSKSLMINYIKLRSSRTGEEFIIFSTMSELREYEVKTHEFVQLLTALDTIDESRISFYVNLVLNLKQKYYDSLNYIGYRPKEIEELYDSMKGEEYYERIGDVYECMPCEEYYNMPLDRMPGLSVLDDVSDKIIYSIESFIKIMKDHM